MFNKIQVFLLCSCLTAGLSSPAAAKKRRAREESAGTITVVLWRDPVGGGVRDVMYGPGGRRDSPRPPFTFVKEDLKGANPKIEIRDGGGVKWTAKFGIEAQPEIAASRLLWAAGFLAPEDYLVRDLRVENLPARLHRGQGLVGPDGSIRNARLKRAPRGFDKIGDWRWRHSPFTGTRELNGLRVMMALINNWDLKDDNNAVYERGGVRLYMVSDVGTSFGSAAWKLDESKAKGNAEFYARSRFIDRVTSEHVDFGVPGRPSALLLFDLPYFITTLRMHWIGRGIPRADARWVGQLLARLSPRQLGEDFRAAGYQPEEAAAFTAVLERRIAELQKL